MKGKRILIGLLILISCTLALSACTNASDDDPYKDYTPSGLEANILPVDYENFTERSGIELFYDYDSYADQNFELSYEMSYFETNYLLVFTVTCCSSDAMEFREILEYEKKLYPLFYRAEIGSDQSVTGDIIVMSYYVEISKESGYEIGEIIFRYK
ncbi:MAG: hypothetical protein ACI4QI_02315 [Candidatus Coproplasma sp.]